MRVVIGCCVIKGSPLLVPTTPFGPEREIGPTTSTCWLGQGSVGWLPVRDQGNVSLYRP